MTKRAARVLATRKSMGPLKSLAPRAAESITSQTFTSSPSTVAPFGHLVNISSRDVRLDALQSACKSGNIDLSQVKNPKRNFARYLCGHETLEWAVSHAKTLLGEKKLKLTHPMKVNDDDEWNGN